VERAPILRGVVQALLAALLFGATAPLVQRASAGSGALSAGCLLYLGAAIATLLGSAFRRGRKEARLGGTMLGRLVIVALLGGMLAPMLFVLGLRRVDAASGALLLALEAPLTLLLAWLIHRERLGPRVLAAFACIFAGGLVLAGRPDTLPGAWLGAGESFVGGAALIISATAAWALDNVLSRPLADRDPVAVVAGKGLIGAAASALGAVSLSQPWPRLGPAAGLLAVGAVGYGLSLQLYLRAQRRIGTARTASVFAAAPFLGAGVAFAIGAPWPGWSFVAAGALIACGVWLHARERHRHAHVHVALSHAHAHTHDDGHHAHIHDPMPVGPHSHEHSHATVMHEHEHGEDLHHRHKH
jgi:drug/metabolite transporter (DMT)-like permease